MYICRRRREGREWPDLMAGMEESAPLHTGHLHRRPLHPPHITCPRWHWYTAPAHLGHKVHLVHLAHLT